MSIQAIDSTSVHRITSGQVVVDLQTAVKELLENALDAGATSVEIRFKEHGVDSIEVQDNGKGIDSSDWSGIALKHHTSKLTSYEDLTSVDTLGFRGEALSSLCGTATLSLITSTRETEPSGTSLSFSSDGNCIVGSKVARPKGTTITVKELFKALPVRRKDLIKNAKREFSKAVELVQSYALIKTGCRIEVKNSVKGKWTTHLQTPLATTVRANFSSIFAPKALSCMMDLQLVLEVQADKSVLKRSDPGVATSTQVIVSGLISKPSTGNGRTTSGRQFFYINGRPFNPTKLSKAFNEVYKTFVNGSFPCIIADFQLPPDAYDVNVSPDKRTIFLHSEGNLIAALKASLEEVFQPSRSTFLMSQIGSKAISGLEKDASEEPHSRSPSVPLALEITAAELVNSKRKRAVSVASEDIDKSDVEDLEEMDQNDELPDNELSDDHSISADTNQQLDKQSSRLAKRQRLQSPSLDINSLPTKLIHASSSSSSLSASGEDPTTSIRRQAIFRPATPPLSLSPSPPRPPPARIPPPQNLKQITLDTSGATWAKKVTPMVKVLPPSTSRASNSGAKGLKAAVNHLNRFLHPSQAPQKIEHGGDDIAEIESDEAEQDELLEEESEAQEFQDEAMEVEIVDSDEEIIIIEDGSKIDQHLNSTSSPLVKDEIYDQERLENLISLDNILDDEERSFRDEIIGPSISADITLSFNLDSISSHWTGNLRNVVASTSKANRSDPLVGASVEQNLEEAEETLSRVVSKEDFESMQIIGQFNLGFIIARRKITVGGKDKGKEKMSEVESSSEEQDDLFIIDQHASDEKYNFEHLQATTVIQSQKLLHPRALNLPSHDEITAIENLDVLRMNGFELLIDEEADVGQRVKLLAQPVSQRTVFGIEDLEELLDLINARSNEEIVRPSKARKMFAMRACRKSVMIGDALSHTQMNTVVHHMGGMVQPWACPHGRPTMRWLASLSTSTRKEKRNSLGAVLQRYQ